MAQLSIYGLTVLKNDPDFDIFSQLQLPTQFEDDPTLITDRLLLDTMELEVLYADPDVFAAALGIYSKSRLNSWQKLADDMFHSYDPFINFTRDEVRKNTVTHNLKDVRTDDLANSNTETTKRNAWDGTTVNNMVPAEEVTDSGTNTGTQTNDKTGTLTTEDYFHSQGDSAMYTPTDIAEKEWKLRASYSVAEYIIADIKTHFCLMVY